MNGQKKKKKRFVKRSPLNPEQNSFYFLMPLNAPEINLPARLMDVEPVDWW